MRLTDAARIIRSKNAGPYELTFDIIFKTRDIYEQVKRTQAIDARVFCELYGIDEKRVLSVIYFDPAMAVKVTILRPVVSGALGESDIYGAQQHAPLLGMELAIEEYQKT